jgi:hypothetical protein
MNQTMAILFFLIGCGVGRTEELYRFTADEDALLEEISRASFEFFRIHSHPVSGLVKDTSISPVCSVASMGFGLAVLPIAAERGYLSKQESFAKALRALKTLNNSNARHLGMFCHFLDLAAGGPTDLGYEPIASSIDTALLIAGAVTAGEYFGGEVKALAQSLYAGVNWAAFVNPENGQVYMSWRADDPQQMHGNGHFEKQTWDWYSDETLLIVLLGLGAPNPEYRLAPEAMTNWHRPTGRYKNGPEYIYTYPGTLFTYMFAHCFYDFRATGPDGQGIDWFENTRRAVLANRDYCRDQSGVYPTYGQNRWGITAGSAPNRQYVVPGHAPRGAASDQGTHGTLHPYGAGMSVPFAPADSLAALREMRHLAVCGKPVWISVEDGGSGFRDGFNMQECWISDHEIGIAQGPMLIMIENARTGLIWRYIMSNPYIREGLRRAGFSGKLLAESAADQEAK